MRKFKAEKQPIPKNTPYFPDIDHEFCDLEIGAGAGMYALQHALGKPDRYLIAIERTKEKFRKFEQSYIAAGRPANLLPIHADAISWLSHFAKPESFHTIFLLYPNPEPKNKNQRWINMPFFSYLLKTLKPEGQLVLATNIRSYAEEFYKGLQENWQIQEVDFNTIDKNANPRSHFEKKYLERKEDCYQVSFIYSP